MASIGTMDAPHSNEIVTRFQEFYENYCGDEIETLAQSYPDDTKSFYLDWKELYRFDRDMAEDYLVHPGRMRDYAEQALTGLELPDEEDVLFTDINVRAMNPPVTTEISELSVRHQGNLVAVEGTVVDANEPEPELREAAFECQRCGTLSYIPQHGEFTKPHRCEGCEREGPFNINFDQSEFVTAQTIRIREGPSYDGTPADELEILLTDDEPTQVYEGEPVRVTGILRFKQKEQDSIRFGKYLDGVTLKRGDGPEPTDWGTEYLGIERSSEQRPGDKELLYEFVGRSRHILNTQELEWEHEVREKIIAPFLHALGWNVYDSEVSIEHTGDDLDARPDYALLDSEGATAAIIEAKALGKINRDARHQIRNYMRTFGAEYGLLTTGHRYIIFRAVDDDDPTEVEVADLVLEELLASSVVAVFSRYTIRGAAADSAAWSVELDISEELQKVVKGTISDLETEEEGAAFNDIVSETEYHPDEVEDAVQTLLRGGQVYEPSDNVLRTI